MKRFSRKNWFVLSLLLVPFLAWQANILGINHGSLVGQILTKLGVCMIFFFSGLMLKKRIFLSTLGNLKLHFSVQLFCYVFIPAFVLSLITLFPSLEISPMFTAGIIILSCMPTTISSCVVLTGLAKGNESGALFNGIFSNLVGIFICPFLVHFFLNMKNTGIDLDPIPILETLVFLVLIPMLLGNISLFYLGTSKVTSWTKKVRFCSSFIVLIIIYIIFFDTFNEMKNLSLSFTQILYLCLQLFVLHLILFSISFFFGLVLKFKEKDLKALIFTAPQKTLALGMPLTIAILNTQELSGNMHSAMIIALPLALYHHLQLLTSGVFLRFKKHIFPKLFPSKTKDKQVSN
jgi:solute carrier family 10 (sodium/bile acid cotransporter), member 7